ncbi:MAG: hypothetical protein V1723_00900 [Candidatus Uhrbacteria bacterium]
MLRLVVFGVILLAIHALLNFPWNAVMMTVAALIGVAILWRARSERARKPAPGSERTRPQRSSVADVIPFKSRREIDRSRLNIHVTRGPAKR